MNSNLIPLNNSDLEAWWERVPGSRRFLQKMASETERNRAVVADISEDDKDGFISIFTDEIQRRNYSIAIEKLTIDGSTGFEDFVMEIASKFDPDYIPDLMSDSIMTDAADKQIFSGYVLFIKVIGKAPWLPEAVKDFNKSNNANKGALIFLTSEVLPSQITLKLSDFISPYDVQFFVINLLENTRLNQIEKLYTASLAAKLAGSSAIIAKNLASPELYHNGRKLAQEIFADEFKEYSFNRAVWETQIQFALPIIETVRENLIEHNLHLLKRILPVTDEFGKDLNNPWDMELRHLHYYGGAARLFSQNDWDILELVYRARNDLSHLESIEVERLDKIFLLND